MKNKLIDFESITAVILSFIGGLLDVYCLYNFGIYGMLHTGNVIKLVTYLIDLDISMFLATLFIIISFAVGVFLANLYSYYRKDKSAKGLLVITIILLVITIFIPNDREVGTLSYIKYISAILFGLEGAFILHSFVKFGDYSYSATTMTANIIRFMSNLFDRIVKKDKSKGYSVLTYALIIIFFMLGVAVGYSYMRFTPVIEGGFMGLYKYNFILLIPLILLIITLILTNIIDKKSNVTEETKQNEK